MAQYMPEPQMVLWARTRAVEEEERRGEREKIAFVRGAHCCSSNLNEREPSASFWSEVVRADARFSQPVASGLGLAAEDGRY